jgi:hypothetical protein
MTASVFVVNIGDRKLVEGSHRKMRLPFMLLRADSRLGKA